MLLATLLLCLLGLVRSIPIDNKVAGDPEVECLSNSVSIAFTTEKSFRGVVYAKDHYLGAEECNQRADGTGAGATVSYQFDTCGVVRRRSLEPKGVFVTGVVVIQFHPFVLTKIDRAIRFQCFYMEADKTVNQDLEVSVLTTEFQTFTVPMPVCRYDILEGDANGPPIKFATIGQQVYHKFTCDTDTQNIFCMEVYGCYVNYENIGSAEEGEAALRLLDEDGCALDGNLLQNLEYQDADVDGARGLMGGRETHVFKYADRAALYFNCQIRIGVLDPGRTCADFRADTGGVCAEAPLSRRRRSAGNELGVMDIAPGSPLYVGDLDLSQEDIPAGLLQSSRRQFRPSSPPTSSDSFCVSQSFFGVLIAFIGVFVVASIALAVILCFRGKA